MVTHIWIICSPPYPGAPNYPAPGPLILPSALLPMDTMNAYAAILPSLLSFPVFRSSLNPPSQSLIQLHRPLQWPRYRLYASKGLSPKTPCNRKRIARGRLLSLQKGPSSSILATPSAPSPASQISLEPNSILTRPRSRKL